LYELASKALQFGKGPDLGNILKGWL
jgi:hypothetical protein